MDKEAIPRRDLLKIAGVSMGTLAMSSYGAIAQRISEISLNVRSVMRPLASMVY